MKTTSFGIANYCVACRSHCRHCLLSSCGNATGVDYETGVSFANRFLDEISGYRQGISCFYYIGYSVDTPKLMDYIEALDERFIEQMPSVNDLAARYGRKDNRQLYRFRDLLLRWRQEYISETGGRIYDMHDETHHFSVHI